MNAFINASNVISWQPWSYTGNNKRPQPDNAELAINGTPESCLAVLNNVYKDGLHWHDVACYHPKAFVCEDSEELLRFVLNAVSNN